MRVVLIKCPELVDDRELVERLRGIFILVREVPQAGVLGGWHGR